MTDCKEIATPIESGLNLKKSDLNENCNAPCRELIGCLTYATLTTRPDLCAATNYLSRFQNCYNHEHFKHAKRVLRYIKATKDLKLIYKKHENSETLIGYTDSD